MATKKEPKPGIIQVTGTKEDVTLQVMACADNLIARLVKEGHLEVPTPSAAEHLNNLFEASRKPY